MRVLRILVILLLVLLLDTGAEAATNPLDRAVLNYIYNATNDRDHSKYNWAGWGNSSSTSDPCVDRWYGITCVEDQSIYYVTGIYFPDHELLRLPDEIVEMKYLQSLMLKGNSFRAEGFPTGIFTMQTLEYLDISYLFYFNFTLPSKINLPNLQHLHATRGNLHGYLPTTWNTPKLESLVLDSNYLKGRLPEEISKCTALKQLMLEDNRLTGSFPASYGQLYQLVNLSLVQSTAMKFGGLCSTLPNNWDTLFSLVDVSLCVTGGLPSFIGDSWLNLQTLKIVSGVYESSIPNSLCKLTRLQYLDLSNNHITGSIPSCIFTMSSLIYLDLAFNGLTGPIPETIGSAQNFQSISLSSNSLNGTLPRSVGNLKNIADLSFANNLLVGEIPTELDMLRSVGHQVRLYLEYNMFSSIGKGLELFFRDIVGDYYGNPFECPLPTYIKYATCSPCNSGVNRKSCEDCVSAGCGWCSYGNNCVEGTNLGPLNQYSCPKKYWNFQTCSGI